MPIRLKLPIILVLVTLVFAGVVALVAAVSLRGVLLDRLQENMARQARQYAAVLEAAPPAANSVGLQRLTQALGGDGEVRFTVVDQQGTVLADSLFAPLTLDNHSGRPEIAQALAGNEGRSRRQSVAMGTEVVYVAVPLEQGEEAWSGGALRAGVPASRIDAAVAASWHIPLIVWAVLLVPTLAFAYLLTRSLTKPLERLRFMTAQVASGALSYRTSVRRNDELGELATSLNTMAAQLETRAEALSNEMGRSSSVLQAMSEGVILMDGDGRLVRANLAASRIFGAWFEGMEGTPLVHLARAFPADSLAESAHAAGHPITEVLSTMEGSSLRIEVVPLQPTGGQRPQTVFVVRDETTRLATERMRRDIVSNVSHELKTPLAGLSLTAQILAQAIREDPQEAERAVHRLNSEVERLTHLINDLLILSRLEEARGEQETRPSRAAKDDGLMVMPPFLRMDVSEVAKAAADEARPLAEAKDHHLQVDTQPALTIHGDEASLRTMIGNLLENAIRYTEPGGSIRLETRKESGPKGRAWAVISVEDDGVGIAKAEQQRIFERFYRIEKDRSRESGGTGLGLSIVRHAAEYHGGGVEVESTLGVGSTFTVRLPLAD